MEYIEFFKKLSDGNIKYLICGGLAANIYGIPRMTADIDLLLDFEKENITDFEKIISSFDYKPVLPIALNTLIDKAKRIKLKKEKNLIAFSYYNVKKNLMSIDVLIEPPISFSKMWKERVERKTGNTKINLISVEHLIEMKKYSDRIQDRQDIIQLTKFKR